MVKVRQDAWSHEDDLLLAETVLRHVREGSTQLNAFDEVGDHLNRTSAACGFRWNAEVRKKYDHAMDLAKRQRKEKKRAEEKSKPKMRRPIVQLPESNIAEHTSLHNESSSLTIDDVIYFLNHIKKDVYQSSQSRLTVEQTEAENQRLKEQVNELEKILEKTKQQLTSVQDDYQVFIQIMDRARKMTVLDDENALKSPSFRMDKNGNLEQIAQGH